MWSASIFFYFTYFLFYRFLCCFMCVFFFLLLWLCWLTLNSIPLYRGKCHAWRYAVISIDHRLYSVLCVTWKFIVRLSIKSTRCTLCISSLIQNILSHNHLFYENLFETCVSMRFQSARHTSICFRWVRNKIYQ